MENKKLIKLEVALQELEGIYKGWGLTADDWCLVDFFAALLQGYNVDIARAKNHLNTYVNREMWPWPTEEMDVVIPPFETGPFYQYTDFMKTTGYRLDIMLVEPSFFDLPKVTFALPNAHQIKMSKPAEYIKFFCKKKFPHLMKLGAYDKHRINYFFDKLHFYEQLAREKGDTELIKVCNEAINDIKNCLK